MFLFSFLLNRTIVFSFIYILYYAAELKQNRQTRKHAVYGFELSEFEKSEI